jgi:hypothetical protein
VCYVSLNIYTAMEKKKLTPDQIMSHVGELIGEHVHVEG